MVASAALVSLLQILNSSLQSAARGRRISLNTAQLKSLHEKVSFLLEFLDNSSPNYGKRKDPKLQSLETKMMLAASKAEGVIVSAISKQLAAESRIAKNNGAILINPHFLLNWVAPLLNSIMCVLPISLQLLLKICFQIGIYFPFFTLLYLSSLPFLIVNPIPSKAISVMHKAVVKGLYFVTRYWRYVYQLKIQDLRGAIDDINCVIKEVIEIKDACGLGQDRESLQSADSAHGLSIDIGRNVVVGLDSYLIEMCGRLTQDLSGLEFVSIVGMGGIGKTTLARQVHDHSYIVHHFDVRSWVAVSQEYSFPHVMLDLLAAASLSDSAKIDTEEILQKHRGDDDLDQRLGEHLHKSLMGRRYLIVMDDVWDTKILDSVRIFLPDRGNGSRVLLTTRLSQVASYANPDSPSLEMQFLNDDDSWHLLCEKAFGGEGCPPELEAIGRAIARKCGGLPLAIAVVGSLLYNEHGEGVWMRVLNDLHSILSEDDKKCLEILGLSYNNLPNHLKPCFLYMGAFLGATEIPTVKLFNLWAAEGFLEPSKSRSLEEVAEEYLKDLIQRNLILIGKQSCNGNIKTCRIHDLLREFCLQNANEEKFLGFDGNIGGGSGIRLIRVLELYI